MNPVIIKSNSHGLVVRLDKTMDFQKLLEAVKEKFKESAEFFKSAQMAIAFEGRDLSPDEEYLLIAAISEVSGIQISCVIETDAKKEQEFAERVDEKINQINSADGGQFYKGTLRNGQILESETSLIVLGDVNPGATVYSAGNVIILGTLTGSVHAGVNGSENAFVVALDMQPMQIRIGDYIARGADHKHDKKEKKIKKEFGTEPKIAFVEDGNIYIEKITKDVINEIPFY